MTNEIYVVVRNVNVDYETWCDLPNYVGLNFGEAVEEYDKIRNSGNCAEFQVWRNGWVIYEENWNREIEYKPLKEED